MIVYLCDMCRHADYERDDKLECTTISRTCRNCLEKMIEESGRRIESLHQLILHRNITIAALVLQCPNGETFVGDSTLRQLKANLSNVAISSERTTNSDGETIRVKFINTSPPAGDSSSILPVEAVGNAAASDEEENK